jgi:hypothetical protein
MNWRLLAILVFPFAVALLLPRMADFTLGRSAKIADL